MSREIKTLFTAMLATAWLLALCCAPVAEEAAALVLPQDTLPIAHTAAPVHV